MPKSLDELTKAVQDAAYVTIGLGVIAFQKAQVQRNELQKQLKGQVGGASKAFEERVKLLEERLQGVESRFESVLDQLEDRLPEQARDIAKQARTAARDARAQVRGLASRAS
jgi:hypothetical protein